MLDSEQIYQHLKYLNLKLNSPNPAYAYEFMIGPDSYLYVKRKGNKDSIPVKKQPLVISPNMQEKKDVIEQIDGVYASWQPYKNTSLRRFPKLDGSSQYGFGLDVESVNALNALVEILLNSEAKLPKTADLKITKEEEKMQPLNQILYGPPGTGKTYDTTKLAVEIASPEWYEQKKNDASLKESEFRAAVKEQYKKLVGEGQVMFTTFHQSFSYEDFIEGIRPVSDDENNLNYKVEDGVFKQLCSNAIREVISSEKSVDLNLDNRKIWKMSLGYSNARDEVYSECIENNYILLGWGGEIDFSSCSNKQEINKKFKKNSEGEVSTYAITAVNILKNEMKKGDLVVISDGNLKFRAIAEVTGEYELLSENDISTFSQMRRVKWLKQFEPSLPAERLFDGSLTQQALYNLKNTINKEKLDQLLSSESSHNSEEPHVLIIDEINRGNISRIFGELITLLEPSKRAGAEDEQSTILPYSKLPFSVPKNVYVIGTMNTADKSLDQLDLALRRRFSFVEMLPNPNILEGVKVYGVDLSELLSVMNERIEILLGSEYLIGHAYFIPVKQANEGHERELVLQSVFRDKLIPLLKEYFFDDHERISWVLNDITKDSTHKFMHAGEVGSIKPVKNLFPEKVLQTNQIIDKRYRINENAFKEPEAYKGIIN